MNRATSTVVDVTVCLLLVGAAVAALVNGAAVERPTTGNPAAERAALLATSTASIEYTLAVPGDPPTWTTNATATHQRTAHGTLAELLAEAAMSRVSYEGHRLSRVGTGFERAVATTTRNRLRERGHRTVVRTRWEPYRGAPLNATMRVGERPPPTADVNAATTTVPSPATSASGRLRRVARASGYRGIAVVAAAATVETLFPPQQAQVALDGDYPADRLMTRRYRRMGALTRAGRLSVESRSTTELNADLTTALAARFERDMRRRFDSPEAAARAVDTGNVTVTVRTWKP
ncbi:DUF7284 family protein [Haloarcula onubensis]|uniref:DUF541 domain-containing protein n=1 Tax=Haloarcula onubensis TaxID=2950539 RepID=A0ABU2FLI0_9EURY|nr:hypothetical protein [Halomicroarcula sp. S3CR25-11]MDS0281147.1 hypothetical protein [Halomicroarcula sp. S3CR25-11]